MAREDKPTGAPFMPSPDAVDITDEQFKKMSEETFRLVEEVGIGEKTMCPAVIIHHRSINEDGLTDIETTCVTIASDFNEQSQKQEVIANIGRKFFISKKIPIAIFLASEAWTSTSNKEMPKVMPSQDPNRKECIMVAGRTLAGECKSLSMTVVGRDSEGRMTKTDEQITQYVMTGSKEGSRIDTNILDHFLHGFFETVKAKMIEEGYKPRQ